MDLDKLIGDLPNKKGAILMLEEGVAVKRSYRKLYHDCRSAEARLRAWGVSAGMRVGIYAPNSYDWLVYDLALLELRAVSVAFTDDFKDAIKDELFDRYKISLLLTTESVAKLFGEGLPYIVAMDGAMEDSAVRLHSILTVDEPADDQLSLVFSSGSAGGLKGLVISRCGVSSTLPPTLDAAGLTDKDRLLLFLPLSNFQQRYLCYGALWRDFEIILTDYTQLFPAMQKLHPTVLLAPPILYQMIHTEFVKQPGWLRSFQLCIARCLGLIPVVGMRRALARVLLPGFHRQFGRRMRMLITGMAPIKIHISKFFDHMHLPLSEAYGMVEAGVMTFRRGETRDYASVGSPIRDVHIDFAQDGEILVSRKHPVALRYFQCADGENERTFLTATQIATGDIGRFNEEGRLVLLGRKKELLVTASGYKVHPELIERELSRCPDVAGSVVFLGHSSDLRCVVSLNNPQDESAKARVKKFAAALKTAKQASPYLHVIFSDTPFTRENGMLRPNMKIDRRNIIARYSVN